MWNDFSCIKLTTNEGDFLSFCWMNFLGCPSEEIINEIRDRHLTTMKFCHSDRWGLLRCGLPHPVTNEFLERFLHDKIQDSSD